MNGRSRLSWLILALLSYSLSVALSANLTSLQSAMPVHRAGMVLQAGPNAEEASAISEDKALVCTHCPTFKREPALALAEGPQRHEGKIFGVPRGEGQPMSKD